MARKSTITQLPPEVRVHLEKLIREQTHTIDEIVAEVQSMGGDVKRTAVGDFKRKMEQRLVRVREAQDVAGVWVESLGEKKDSPMGQLVAEILKTVAFQTITDLADSDEPVKPMDLMLLSKTLQQVSGAQKADHEYRRKLRDEWLAEIAAKTKTTADEVKKAARSGGLTEEAAEDIRKNILGIAN
jgi:hypothetical protein